MQRLHHPSRSYNPETRSVAPESRGGLTRRSRLPIAWGIALLVLSALLAGAVDVQAADDDMGVSPQMRALQAPPLSVEDLPQELNLTPRQVVELQKAMDRMHRERPGDRRSWGRSGGPRHPDCRCEGCRDGWGNGRRGGWGDGRGPRGGGPAGLRARGGGRWGSFLADVSRTLDADQFALLAQHLAKRREEYRPSGRRSPAGVRQELPPGMGRRLELTEEQEAKLREVWPGHAAKIEELRRSLAGESLTPEQARDRAREIRTAWESDLATILGAERWTELLADRASRISRQADRRARGLERQLEGRSESLARILGLTHEQAREVESILLGTAGDRRDVLVQMKNGSMAPEDAAYQMWKLESAANDKIRKTITKDQRKRFDALEDLLPRGQGHGFGMLAGLGAGLGPGPEGPGARDWGAVGPRGDGRGRGGRGGGDGLGPRGGDMRPGPWNGPGCGRGCRGADRCW